MYVPNFGSKKNKPDETFQPDWIIKTIHKVETLKIGDLLLKGQARSMTSIVTEDHLYRVQRQLLLNDNRHLFFHLLLWKRTKKTCNKLKIYDN